LPAKNRKTGLEIRGKLQNLGIIRKTGHEHFSGSIVFPIIDEQENITEVYGRKIRDNLRSGTAYHLYLPGPHAGALNIKNILAAKEIILCESIIDALTFWTYGFENVTASYGVEGFTQEILDKLVEIHPEKVLIAYDRDLAGDKAAKKVAAKLSEHGIESYRINFPKDMDANQYAIETKNPTKSLARVIRNAYWLGGSRKKAAKKESKIAPVKQDALKTDTSFLNAKEDFQIEQKTNEIKIEFGNRKYRIRGMQRNMSFDVLKINLLVKIEDAFYVDTLDLYSARQRAGYIKQTAKELNLKEDVIKKDLGKLLLKLEEIQEENINRVLAPKEKKPILTEEERKQALAFLKNPNLLDKILQDFDTCGVIGETSNKLIGYLATISRKLTNPLAVIIQSSSAAGKTALMESILAFIPEEEKVKYSAITGQSLFYMKETDLKNKVLAIVEEEGAEKASYALKLLQSEGEITIASTGKDATNGRLTTHEYRVEGPVMILLTTTAIEIDEELLNRCIVLTVNEDRKQTKAIHKRQREKETLKGLLAMQDKSLILKTHKNAHRLLRPILVANPYAEELTFIDDKTRCRRDHVKYLTLIRTIALLHQYQRPVKRVLHNDQEVRYIEVTIQDMEVANKLAHEILGRTLDELAPQTRRLLLLLKEMVTKRSKVLKMDFMDYRFTRREIRDYTGFGYEQVRIHLDRLVNLEYVLVHRGGRGQSFVYELLYNGPDEEKKPFLMGLIDVEKLKNKSMTKSLL
jgi:hypothetical protein